MNTPVDGYKTYIVFGVALLVSALGYFGIVVDTSQTTDLTLGVMAVVGIVMRFWTTKTSIAQAIAAPPTTKTPLV